MKLKVVFLGLICCFNTAFAGARVKCSLANIATPEHFICDDKTGYCVHQKNKNCILPKDYN